MVVVTTEMILPITTAINTQKKKQAMIGIGFVIRAFHKEYYDIDIFLQ